MEFFKGLRPLTFDGKIPLELEKDYSFLDFPTGINSLEQIHIELSSEFIPTVTAAAKAGTNKMAEQNL